MARKRSAHLLRQIIEGMSSYSAYKGAKLSYAREYDSTPLVNVDLTTRIDIHRAVKILWKRRELSEQEIKMLYYVMLDGRLSRRDMSAMIKEYDGVYVDQRTISRRLESAYWKLSKFLGWEYSDNRMYQMIAKRMGKPVPYILSDEEIADIQMKWERV